MHYRTLIPLALLAAFINIIPLLMVIPAGDTVMNYMMMDCFGKQLWSGILYPRWCMDANAGLGSPAPIFYFPLPFYITAIFAPLQSWGFTLPQQYLLGVYTANFTAFICCFAWLSRLVSRRNAIFCAFIFLLGFYRAEMMTRASYAEYWCVAFLPLLFMLTHIACHSTQRTWHKFAAVITVCMLCHAPATLIGLMGAGIYALLAHWRALIPMGIGGAIATLITLPHYLPMKLLIHTLNDEISGTNHWRRSWVNGFADALFFRPEHTWKVAALCIGLSMLLIMLTLWWSQRCQLNENARREGMRWTIIGIFASLMLFSISAPVWFIVAQISGVATPWRMQMLVMFALFALVALLVEYCWFQNKRHKVGDRILCIILFVFIFLFYSGGVTKEHVGIHKTLISLQPVINYFSVRDTAAKYVDVDLFYHDFVDIPNRSKAQWIKGSGSIKVEQWNAHGIIITGKANTTSTLRLEHFYYPIWQAKLNDKSTPLTPESISGRMMVAVPKGDFILELTMDYWGMLMLSATPE